MRNIISIIILVILLAGAGLLLSSWVSFSADSAGQSSYSLAQVESHNKPADCFVAVNGQVYDLSPWISEHPGGSEAIIKLCGRDGSKAFNDKHGGQDGPAQALAQFLIGSLSK